MNHYGKQVNHVLILWRSKDADEVCMRLFEWSTCYHILNESASPSFQDFRIKLTLRVLGICLFHSPEQEATFPSDILAEHWRAVDFSYQLLSTVWCVFALVP